MHTILSTLHTLLFYLSATSREDRNAQTNFRNGPHGHWKYSLLFCNDSGTLKHTLTTLSSIWQAYKKTFRKRHTHTHIHIHKYTHAFAYLFDTSAQCTLAITDYSSTERMCIQHQRSSYVTITTVIYTVYCRIAGRAKFTGPLEKVRRNGDPYSSSLIIQNNTSYICIFSRETFISYRKISSTLFPFKKSESASFRSIIVQKSELFNRKYQNYAIFKAKL